MAEDRGPPHRVETFGEENMRHPFILGLAVATLLSSCATNQFSKRFPDATVDEQSFVRFLCHDGHMTPWQVRNYLRTNNIAFKLKQNRWLGEDRWDIAGCGKWIAHYTGRKRSELIPIDLSLFHNQTCHAKANQPHPLFPPGADDSMFVSYDTMAQMTRAFSVRFDRVTNTAITEQGGGGNALEPPTHPSAASTLARATP